MKLRRLRLSAAALVGAVVASGICSDLNDCGVQGSLMAVCSLAVFANVTATVDHLWIAATATTHRCTVRGCDFRVRLSDPTAAESRRWQEAAAAHPTHRAHSEHA
ncbi:hypothetical protein [Streptomyces sp. NPDC051162]|uniref:hypothetical protein n=1 Tax=Streptomyces sp. NPDC051162 TaxID=3154747 RepID=UPI0034381362